MSSYARVLFDFSPSAEGEIEVKANDVVLVTEFGSDGWWDVVREDGSEGVVPEAYCALVDSNAEKKPVNVAVKELRKDREPSLTPSSTPPSADEAEMELIRKTSILKKKLSIKLIDTNPPALVSSPSPPPSAEVESSGSFTPPRSPSAMLESSPFARPKREWYINAKSFAFYKTHFDRLSKGGAFVDGREAARFLLGSKIPKHVLARLLEISDMDGRCQFDRDQFAVAFHLTRCVSMYGMPIPDELPKFLIPKSRRGK